MLILARSIGESLIIGDQEIAITLLSQKGNQIRIGIEETKDVSIQRDEIFRRIQDELEIENNKEEESIKESGARG